MNKEKIYEEVQRRIGRDPDVSGILTQARCFFFAVHAIEAIREQGQRAILQAGNASWKRIPPEMDDGVSADAFGYVWSPKDLSSQIAISLGGMPEMHVWAGILPAGEIVDMTTGFFPEQAKLLCDYDWPGKRPPKYFWDTPDKLEFGYYEPLAPATEYAVKLALRLYGKERTRNLFS